MFNFTITLIFCLFQILSFAQTSVYHAFPESNAVWRWQCDGLGSGCCCNCFGNCLVERSYQDSIGGDTVFGFNTSIYHTIWESSISEYYYSGPPNCAPGGYASNVYNTVFYFYRGAIRQDTLQKKVYFTYDGATETLFYDFNLQLGDTLTPSFIMNSENYYVSRIDSIEVVGVYRKRFWLWDLLNSTAPNGQEYVAYIEGIGSTFGLFEGLYQPFEYTCGLNCVQMDTITYISPNAFNCASLLLGVGLDENDQTTYNITVTPNPFSSTSVIQSEKSFTNAQLKLYNMMGQCVKSVFEIQGKSYELSCENLKNGIYFINIMENNQIIGAKKIIILE